LVSVSSSYRCGSLSDFLRGVLTWNRVSREREGERESREGGRKGGGEGGGREGEGVGGRESGFGQELSAVGQEPHNNTIARYDYYCVS